MDLEVETAIPMPGSQVVRLTGKSKTQKGNSLPLGQQNYQFIALIEQIRPSSGSTRYGPLPGKVPTSRLQQGLKFLPYNHDYKGFLLPPG